MSHYTIAIVMDRLLIDEAFRLRFEADRVDALGELHAHGLELTPPEIDLFIESDVRMWSWIAGRIGDYTH